MVPMLIYLQIIFLVLNTHIFSEFCVLSSLDNHVTSFFLVTSVTNSSIDRTETMHHHQLNLKLKRPRKNDSLCRNLIFLE